jgi:glutathione S-transferase
MKLYHSLKPHPLVGAGREVRIVLHEKGLRIPSVDLDMMSGENRRAAFMEKNPAGQLPALELDDGRVIAESVAICELLEDLHPAPALIGSTPAEKAETRMWQRRIELGITENIYNGWRFSDGQQFWRSRGRVIPEAAGGLRATARDKLVWLDGLLRDKPFIAGERYTLADVLLLVGLDFAAAVGQRPEEGLAHIARWRSRMAERASSEASLRALDPP